MKKVNLRKNRQPYSSQQKTKALQVIDLQGFALVSLRSGADSNRRTRFCRPLPSHSATRPFQLFTADCPPFAVPLNLPPPSGEVP